MVWKRRFLNQLAIPFHYCRRFQTMTLASWLFLWFCLFRCVFHFLLLPRNLRQFCPHIFYCFIYIAETFLPLWFSWFSFIYSELTFLPLLRRNCGLPKQYNYHLCLFFSSVYSSYIVLPVLLIFRDCFFFFSILF